MELNDIRRMKELLWTATESVNEAMSLVKKTQTDAPLKRAIYVTQQRPQGSIDDDGWRTLFADANYDQAKKWVDSHNSENALFHLEYRVITIDLYLD